MAELGDMYLEALRDAYQGQKALAERAAAQLQADDITRQIDPESNSVAVLMRHVGGNLRSRFTDFLSSDGEKDSRDRDGEFAVRAGEGEAEAAHRAWREGWATLEGALAGLAPADLERTVTIRGEAHTVPRALERSLAHTSHHIGQIVFLAKHLRGGAWRTLSIPRGQSRGWRPPGGRG